MTHNTTLTFEGLVPKSQYWGYAAYYDGYRGFDFSDLELITQKGINYEELQHTGFQNALHGDCEAFTTGHYGVGSNGSFVTGYDYGWIKAPNATYTFNLLKGVFASGSVGKVDLAFRSFYANGTQKAEVHLHVTKNATTIDFAHYGGDFTDISALQILSTWNDYPYPVVFDNLKVQWNAGARPGPHAHHHPLIVAALTANSDAATHDADSPHGAAHDAVPAHHTELTSLTGGRAAADVHLTSLFSLPTLHFSL